MGMIPKLPQAQVPRIIPTGAKGLELYPWDALPVLAPFVVAAGDALAVQQTRVRLGYDDAALYLQFECDDTDIWGTYTQRDDPIYDEEVVELFISPGTATPTRYYEIELSPNGVLFDARIYNPTNQRADLHVDVHWNPAIVHRAWRDDAADRWGGLLAVPWAALVDGPPPTSWRANVYRIERPRGSAPEFSCWSPTFTAPADFHRPDYFGTLVLAES